MEIEDKQMGSVAANQFFSIFILPEINRRQEAGLLPQGFILKQAQVLFPPDGTTAKVRLNDEIRVRLEMELVDEVEKQPGEPVYAHELERIGSAELVPPDDLDSGFVLLLFWGGQNYLFFDFIYNKDMCRSYAAKADEFLSTAKYARENHLVSSLIDNLFSAAELAAKGISLNRFPDAQLRESRKHTAVHSRFNHLSKTGLVEARFVRVFNELSNLRQPARYGREPVTLEDEQIDRYLTTIGEMVEHLRRLIPVKVERSGE